MYYNPSGFWKLKDVRWLGDSRRRAHRFPKGARVALGRELTRVQLGLMPHDFKWLSNVGPGVQEIRIAFSKEAYRLVYVAVLGDCVYVLHAFHKKSTSGVRTPRVELDLAKTRYRELIRSRKMQ